MYKNSVTGLRIVFKRLSRPTTNCLKILCGGFALANAVAVAVAVIVAVIDYMCLHICNYLATYRINVSTSNTYLYTQKYLTNDIQLRALNRPSM